ncbi:MAG: hypothetical protein ACRD16_15565 [Thermoanaerobaculia bacterium]
MKGFAVISLMGLLALIVGCASTEREKSLPDTPDPSGARRLARDWIFTMKAGPREIDGKLHFSYDGSFVTGSFTEIGGEVRRLSDIRVSKDRMVWKIDDGRGVEQLTGSFSEDGTLTGTMTRARKKEAESATDEGNEGSAEGGSQEGMPGGEGSRGYGRGGNRGRHGGGHGGGENRQRSSATWTAVPAPKADAPAPH